MHATKIVSIRLARFAMQYADQINDCIYLAEQALEIAVIVYVGLEQSKCGKHQQIAPLAVPPCAHVNGMARLYETGHHVLTDEPGSAEYQDTHLTPRFLTQHEAIFD